MIELIIAPPVTKLTIHIFNPNILRRKGTAMNCVSCPNCHQPIDIDQVLAHQIEENLAAKFQRDLAQQEQKLKRELWDKAQEEATKKIQASSEKTQKELQERLKEQEKRATAAEATE